MSKETTNKENNMTDKQFTFFHGDLDFFKVDKLPEGAKLTQKTKEHVAQHGTATGHKHLVSSDKSFSVYEYGEAGLVYIFDHPAIISHEEHRTHDIGPGIYVVEHEQEENPRTGMVATVVD